MPKEFLVDLIWIWTAILCAFARSLSLTHSFSLFLSLFYSSTWLVQILRRSKGDWLRLCMPVLLVLLVLCELKLIADFYRAHIHFSLFLFFFLFYIHSITKNHNRTRCIRVQCKIIFALYALAFCFFVVRFCIMCC